jgi:prepilin-type processing-associated H-X9-DG protein
MHVSASPDTHIAEQPAAVRTARSARRDAYDDDPIDLVRSRKSAPNKSYALVYTLIALGVCFLLACPVLILLALLLPAVQKVREAAARMQSANNEKQLILAMQNYESTTGHLPLAYDLLGDDPAKPRVEGASWRVAVLPYFGESTLYNNFDPKKPWDSPANVRVGSTTVKTFRDPSDPSAPNTLTLYQVFVTSPGKSPHAAFNYPTDPRPLVRVQDFTRGTSNTILLAESGAPVPWSAPRDMAFDPDQALPALAYLHGSKCPVGMADGSVRFAPQGTNPTTLKSLITRDGNDPIVIPDW